MREGGTGVHGHSFLLGDQTVLELDHSDTSHGCDEFYIMCPLLQLRNITKCILAPGLSPGTEALVEILIKHKKAWTFRS